MWPLLRVLTVFVASTLTNLHHQATAAVTATQTFKTDLGAINASMLDSTVEVQATIQSISLPREGSGAPYRVKLGDETGTITLVLWPNVWDVLNPQHHLDDGDLVRIRAGVSRYRDEIQLKLDDPANFQVLSKAKPPPPPPPPPSPPPPPKITSLASITEEMKGQEIVVQATIVAVRQPERESSPYIATLSERGTTVAFVFWKPTYDVIGPKIRVGNLIRATVTVGEFRGKLQVEMRSPMPIDVIPRPQ